MYEKGLLGVEAIFGLVEDDRSGTVDDVVGDFLAAVRGQAVHEDGVVTGRIHEVGVHLIWAEGLEAGFELVFESHADPGIGVDGVGAADCFSRIADDLDGGRSVGDRPGFGDGVGAGLESIRAGQGYGHTDPGSSGDKGVGDVEAVADVSQFETFQATRAIAEG